MSMEVVALARRHYWSLPSFVVVKTTRFFSSWRRHNLVGDTSTQQSKRKTKKIRLELTITRFLLLLPHFQCLADLYLTCFNSTRRVMLPHGVTLGTSVECFFYESLASSPCVNKWLFTTNFESRECLFLFLPA